MNALLLDWAARHRVDPAALAELRALLIGDAHVTVPPGVKTGEDYVQSLVRLEAARKGVVLWRNNVGVTPPAEEILAAYDAGRTPRPVRYGLANDSKQLNEKLKSADLVGWKPVTITHADVGRTIAQFTCREIKPVGWKFTGAGREEAQARWAALVTADGGDACFAAGEGTFGI